MSTTSGNDYEADLLEKFAKGDQLAFEKLYSKYKSLLYRSVLKMTKGNSDTAEDICSDVWMKLIKNPYCYELKSGVKFSTWLIEVAKNRYLDWIKKPENRIVKVELSVFLKGNDIIDSKVMSLPDYLSISEEKEAIRKAITRLPLDYKITFFLWLRKHSYEEISLFTDVPINTVKSRLRESKRLVKSTVRVILK